MISKPQFKHWITVLTTAHSKRLSSEEKDVWWNEVKKCDPETLKATLPDLKLCEWFPAFKDFWSVYNRLKEGSHGQDWKEQLKPIPEEDRVKPEQVRKFLEEFNKNFDDKPNTPQP